MSSGAGNRKHDLIDVFGHIVPSEYSREIRQRGLDRSGITRVWQKFDTPLSDAPRRVEMMDECGIEMQVLTVAAPPLEEFANGNTGVSVELARLANDGIAGWVAEYPSRFMGVATIPTEPSANPAKEIERAVVELGLGGILLFADSSRRPLDAPEMDDIFMAADALGVPIWLHPWRTPRRGDYIGETESKHQASYAIGWPYETTLAMFRLSVGRVMERHPNIRVIVHHAGSMIPLLWTRIEHIYSQDLAAPSTLNAASSAHVLAQLRNFYVDTVTFGSKAALMSAYEFFGPDRMLFGTDCPFDGADGRILAGQSMQTIESMPISSLEKQKILSTNFLDLLSECNRLREGRT